jgi:hypothetical protein
VHQSAEPHTAGNVLAAMCTITISALYVRSVHCAHVAHLCTNGGAFAALRVLDASVPWPQQLASTFAHYYGVALVNVQQYEQVRNTMKRDVRSYKGVLSVLTSCAIRYTHIQCM